MPGAEIVSGTRIVASPAALEAATWPPGLPVLRIAADEVFILGAADVAVPDGHAITEVGDEGYSAVEMSVPELEAWMARESEWRLPASDPAFGQGMVAGLPVKVWRHGSVALVLTRASFATELEARL